MENVNKTLYIPLYGKAFVSKKGIILDDKKAEWIWEQEKFPLKKKSRSKWLAYYTAMRAKVFDEWTKEKLQEYPDAIVLHLGCGMDSRVERTTNYNRTWFDVDFLEVILERKKYYAESERYRMLGGDIRNDEWLACIPPTDTAIIVMEGVSMYLSPFELERLFRSLDKRFSSIFLLTDCYSCLAAKLSKIKNPVNDVGVKTTYGLDTPTDLEISENFKFIKQWELISKKSIDELFGFEKFIFKHLYAGKTSKKLYRIYEYAKRGALY